MATNRLQRAIDRLEAHRIELERQIVSEIEQLYFSDVPPMPVTAPSPESPARVLGNEHAPTAVDTPSSITWLDTD
jgi:hypothetical protein